MSKEFYYGILLEGYLMADTKEEVLKKLKEMQEEGTLGADTSLEYHADITDMPDRG